MTAPLSDSKGAAIDKIIGELQWRTVNKDGERGAELAKQAILAILAQEVKRARVDELQRLIGTHNNDPSTVRYDVLTIDRDLLNKRLERLG